MKRRTQGTILQTAIEDIMGKRTGGYYWGESIYRVLINVWRIAFGRGHAKGMKDAQDIARDEMDKTRRDFEKAQ